jgi:hypothetical protein
LAMYTSKAMALMIKITINRANSNNSLDIAHTFSINV